MWKGSDFWASVSSPVSMAQKIRFSKALLSQMKQGAHTELLLPSLCESSQATSCCQGLCQRPLVTRSGALWTRCSLWAGMWGTPTQVLGALGIPSVRFGDILHPLQTTQRKHQVGDPHKDVVTETVEGDLPSRRVFCSSP